MEGEDNDTLILVWEVRSSLVDNIPVNTKVNPSRQWGVMVASSVNADKKLSVLGSLGNSFEVAWGSAILSFLEWRWLSLEAPLFDDVVCRKGMRVVSSDEGG